MKYTSGSFLKGAIIGSLVPIGGSLIVYALFDLFGRLVFGEVSTTETFALRTITLLGLAVNLWPFHHYLNRSEYNTVRGLILPTIIYAFVWFFYFHEAIFSL
jgi:hypothetical protein